MEVQNCLICKKQQAKQKNSHLVPSFMAAKIFSYDGKGKRGKEVMFTITNQTTTTYIGELPDTKIEELFGKEPLSDERIEKELKYNTITKDYIFCPACEQKLSRCLENHYADYIQRNSHINPKTAYFFWMSIVWRMSISKLFGFSLPSNIEKTLGELLNHYLNFSMSKCYTDEFEECNFSYRLLRSPFYSTNGMGCIIVNYDTETGILMLTIGEFVLCVKFEKHEELPNDFEYWGLESYIKSATINNGSQKEVFSEVENTIFDKAMMQMIKSGALIRKQEIRNIADTLWRTGKEKTSMPDIIFDVFVQKYYSKDTQNTMGKTQQYIKAFTETLQHFGIEITDNNNNNRG